MCFTGNPGTGKTTVAMRMAQILHRLGYVRKGHLVAVTRDDLVGQYIGHTAPKTKEVLKKRDGRRAVHRRGVLPLSPGERARLRPGSHRDTAAGHGEQRDDLVVILAGYKDRMETFFRSNPGMSSRIAHHIDFPDYSAAELCTIADGMLERMHYRFDEPARRAFARIHRATGADAAFRQRAFDPQRAGPRSPAPGEPTVRAARADRRGGAAHDRGAGHPREPRVLRNGHEATRRVMSMQLQYGRTTLSKFIIEEQRQSAERDEQLTALINDIQTGCKYIAAAIARGPLQGAMGSNATRNVQGEVQQKLDVVANDIMLRSCEWGGQLAGMVSEELPEAYPIPSEYPRGRYLLAFDPLDGSSNIDVNVTVGTVFSILRAPRGTEPAVAADFLQPGTEQVCAGYALYGPAAMLVLTLGRGVHGFTLDPEIGAYILTHPNMRIPDDTREFAINASNERFWEPPVQRYVSECVRGQAGVRGADFNMRWIASLVAEVHRILMRGGLFMYPRDNKDPKLAGRLRLLYEANPMAMIIEQAGGACDHRPRAHPRHHPGVAAPARTADPRVPQRGRASGALPSRIRRRHRRGLRVTAVQHQVAADRRLRLRQPQLGDPLVRQASDHRDHRLLRRRDHHGHQDLRADLPARETGAGAGRRRRLPSLRPRRNAPAAGGCGEERHRAVATSGPRPTCSRSSRRCSAATRVTGTGRTRKYLHNAEEAAPYAQPPGTFTPWEDVPANTDLLFYEGLHGAVIHGEVNLPRHVDLLVGVVPIINLEWIQKLHRDKLARGYTQEAVVDTILRRMPDYVNYICPQFSQTHVNFQRVPIVDTSNPFIARDMPSSDESMLVIRFANPKGIDFQYLLSMLHDSFMSRPNTIVCPGSKMGLAMQLIFTPMILRLIDNSRRSRIGG